MVRSIQDQFRLKFRESGYTATQIVNALVDCEGNLAPSEWTIRRYAKKNHLAVGLEEIGIKNPGGGVKYLIKESDLGKLLEVMERPVSVEDVLSALDEIC